MFSLFLFLLKKKNDVYGNTVMQHTVCAER